MTTAWRPKQAIRVIAVAVIRRRDELLLMEVLDDAGRRKGWRPLGGGVEFGEMAAAAVARELREELHADLAQPRLLTVLDRQAASRSSEGVSGR